VTEAQKTSFHVDGSEKHFAPGPSNRDKHGLARRDACQLRPADGATDILHDSPAL
jgi:hypothetical protein